MESASKKAESKKKSIESRAREWLDELGVTFEDIEEGGHAWHIRAQWPRGSNWNLNLLQPKDQPDSIYVLAGARVNEYHQSRFRDLSPESQQEFLEIFSGALTSPWVGFDVQWDEGPPRVPVAFHTEVALYEDGLTKTEFMRAMRMAHNIRLRGVAPFQNRFGTSDDPQELVDID